jgi:hypothetical protein|tara:strand:- start:95 stop:229 length:135 start_codon:yes stop_codon:yes gene_type:complete
MVKSKEGEGNVVSSEQQTLEKYSIKEKIKSLTSKILTKLPFKKS